MKPIIKLLMLVLFLSSVSMASYDDYQNKPTVPREAFSSSDPINKQMSSMNTRIMFIQPPRQVQQPVVLLAQPVVQPMPAYKPPSFLSFLGNAITNIPKQLGQMLVAAIRMPIDIGHQMAIGIGKLYDRAAQTAVTVYKGAVGVVSGVLSGDIFRNQPAQSFSKTGPAIVTINGVFTGNASAATLNRGVNKAFGVDQSVAIRNGTFYKVGDIAQIVGHELGGLDKPAFAAAREIQRGIKEKGQVFVVAHSQGTAIFAQALTLIPKADRANIHYLGIGPQWIVGTGSGLASAKNVMNHKDPVPRPGNYVMAALNVLLPSRAQRVLSPTTHVTQPEAGSPHSYFNYQKHVEQWAVEMGFNRPEVPTTNYLAENRR